MRPVKVILASLEKYTWYAPYRDFPSLLRNAAAASTATNPPHTPTTPIIGATHKRSELFMALSDASLSAVLVTEPSVIERMKHRELGIALALWARAGGTVVFGGACSAFITQPKLDTFWRYCFGLPWRTGECRRASFRANEALGLDLDLGLGTGSERERVSMQALHMHGVDVEHAVFVPDGGEVVRYPGPRSIPINSLPEAQGWGPDTLEGLPSDSRMPMSSTFQDLPSTSQVLDPSTHKPSPSDELAAELRAVQDDAAPEHQAPVVFAPYFHGRVGWVGDLNNEKQLVPVVAAMLGL